MPWEAGECKMGKESAGEDERGEEDGVRGKMEPAFSMPGGAPCPAGARRDAKISPGVSPGVPPGVFPRAFPWNFPWVSSTIFPTVCPHGFLAVFPEDSPAHSEAVCRGAARPGIVGGVSGGDWTVERLCRETKVVQYSGDRADRRYGEAAERSKSNDYKEGIGIFNAGRRALPRRGEA